jgi:hypothetical protein
MAMADDSIDFWFSTGNACAHPCRDDRLADAIAWFRHGSLEP